MNIASIHSQSANAGPGIRQLAHEFVNDNALIVAEQAEWTGVIASIVDALRPRVLVFVLDMQDLHQLYGKLARTQPTLSLCSPMRTGILPSADYDAVLATPADACATSAETARALRIPFTAIIFAHPCCITGSPSPIAVLTIVSPRDLPQPRVFALTAPHDMMPDPLTLRQVCTQLGIHRVVKLCDNSSVLSCIMGSCNKSKTAGPSQFDIRHTPQNAPNRQERHCQDPQVTLFERVLCGKATVLAGQLVDVVLRMEAAIAAASPKLITTPVRDGRPFVQWTKQAHAAAAILTGTPAARCVVAINPWYTALRILVLSWEHADWAAVKLLHMELCDTDEAIAVWPESVAKAIHKFWNVAPRNLQVLFRLRGILTQQLNQRSPLIVVIVDLPIMAHIVASYIRTESTLSSIVNLMITYNPEETTLSNGTPDVHAPVQNAGALKIRKTNVFITTSTYFNHIKKISCATCVVRLHSEVWLDNMPHPARELDAQDAHQNSCLKSVTSSVETTQIQSEGIERGQSTHRENPSEQVARHEEDEVKETKLVPVPKRVGPELLFDNETGMDLSESTKRVLREFLRRSAGEPSVDPISNSRPNKDPKQIPHPRNDKPKEEPLDKEVIKQRENERMHSDILKKKNLSSKSIVMQFAANVGATVEFQYQTSKSGQYRTNLKFSSKARAVETKGWAAMPGKAESIAASRMLTSLKQDIFSPVNTNL